MPSILDDKLTESFIHWLRGKFAVQGKVIGGKLIEVPKLLTKKLTPKQWVFKTDETLAEKKSRPKAFKTSRLLFDTEPDESSFLITQKVKLNSLGN